MSKLARLAQPSSHNHSLQVHNQSCSIRASNCISKLARSRPVSASPSSLNHSLQLHLQTRSIAASKCISKLPLSWPPSASPNSLDYSLQVNIQTRSITASECISKFTRPRCGGTVELEGSQPIIHTLLHHPWYLKGIDAKDQF